MKAFIHSIFFYSKAYPLVFIALVSGLFLLPGLGGVHLFDWDEINFAEASREMLLTGDWLHVQIDFVPFWEKPPLFFWLQAMSMHLFGVNEYAARLPNAIAGIISLIVLFKIGQKWHGNTFGFLWAAAYFGSVLPFLYFKSGIIDPWFNLFIFIGLYQFICFHWKHNKIADEKSLNYPSIYYLFLAGLFIGLGVLTKGPVAFLLAVLTMGVYWVYARFKLYINISQFLFFCLSACLVTLLWYGVEVSQNDSSFFKEFIQYQYRLFSTPDAGHKGFTAYHFVVLLVGCFPASIFMIKAFFRKSSAADTAPQNDLRRWMKYLFWVVLIVFSIVQSKIVHYSSLCYFPLTYLAALTINDYIKQPKESTGWIQLGLFFVGSLYVIATIFTPWLGQNIELLHPLLEKDAFALANLEAEVYWSGLEVLPGLLLSIILLLGIRYLRKQQITKAAFILFGGTSFFVWLTLFFYINRIEAYSQRAAIDFFKSKQSEHAYFTTYGYKSYAHLYYTNKALPDDKRASDREWLLNGEINRDVYIVSKINKAAPLLEREDIKKITTKNGFVFFLRKTKVE